MPDSDLKKLAQNIRNTNKSLYSSIYYTDNNPNQQIKFIKNRIDKALTDISNSNLTNTGVNNISTLYNKTLANKDREQIDLYNNISAMLNNKSVMDNVLSVYTQNTMVRDIDREIDMVCKYMPKLDDALETRKEHVLSADHFTKDPIMIKAEGNDSVSVQNNINTLEKKYNLDNLMDKIYDDTDKRGECFVYIVPYKKAFEYLLKQKMSGFDSIPVRISQEAVDQIIDESYHPIEMEPIIEATKEDFEDLTKKQELKLAEKEREEKALEEVGSIQFSLNTSGVIPSAVKAYYMADRFLSESGSLFFTEKADESSPVENSINKAAKGSIGRPASEYNSMAQDGISILNQGGNKNNTVKIPGCVVKILDHTMVKPLYIDQICLGYFYIECQNKIGLEQTTFSSTIGGIRPGGFNKSAQDPYSAYGNEYIVLKDLANKISQSIDAKFINANQDLSKEIYAILKYNTTVDNTGKIAKVNITFIPPEDMEHCWFDFDEDTKRGKSALLKSLFPAKLFSCLYISNVIQNLTRGNDRRVYYVKQSVDTNIAGVVSNLINQIQRSNFGLRQIESMSNVLNMLGRFNDFVIPRSPSGDAPIDFEVIPGQQAEIKTDLMNMLEEMAVNATEVPLEVIQMRQQVDYATHLTMTNTKFLQKIYNRQGKTQKIFSRIITKIYNYEYNTDSDTQTSIKVVLPPPIYLNAVNGSQIVDAINTLSDTVSNIYVSDIDETNTQGLRVEFGRLVKKQMIENILPKDIIEQALEQAKLNSSKASEE